jgi:thioredoxin-dependent peroxiredoxin
MFTQKGYDMTLKVGDKAPEFNTHSTHNLAHFKGKYIILYFYPKDDTPGCTKEACAFRDMHEGFSDKNAVIIGVSKDSQASHEKFTQKYGLPFILLSDTDGSICEAYGVWIQKSFMGKKYMGIDRSTFLIDPQGKIEKIWRGVKVAGHVEEIWGSLV